MGRSKQPRLRINTTLLHELQTARGYDKQTAADACGMGRNGYAQALRDGEATPEVVQKLAGGYGVTVEQLTSPTRCSLLDVFRRFAEWEANLDGDLLLDAIGIDVTDGQQILASSVTNRQSQTIQVRVLMLIGLEELTCLNVEPTGPRRTAVEQWARSADTSFETIITSVPSGLGSANTLATLQLHRYDRIPELHGVRASKANQRLYGISRCRLLGTRPDVYVFGQDEYRLCELAPDKCSTGEFAEWDRLFEELWPELPRFSWPSG